MRLLPKRSTLSIALVPVMALVLVVMAVLQYRWSGQVSQAERERMEASLHTSVNQFRFEFNRELRRICTAFLPDRGAMARKDWSGFVHQYEDWLNSAPDPQLVGEIFRWDQTEGETAHPYVFVPASGKFEPVSPERLGGLRNLLKGDDSFLHEAPVPPELRASSWFMFYDPPILVHRIFVFPRSERRRSGEPPYVGYLAVALNMKYIRGEFLPELAMRYFGGPDGFVYHVGIFDRRDPGRIIYGSDPGVTPKAFAKPDARTGLLWGPRDYFSERPERREEARPRPAPDERRREGRFRPGSYLGRGRNPIVLLPVEGGNWLLSVKHRQGSLEAVVASLRRRNLAVSFGILLLLGLSMALLVVNAQRAQKLARMQMEFLAGVSHELRTPLSVICSAGDNLAHGVISASGDQVRHYGELIHTEGRKLTRMVEQILQFAGTRAGRRKYNLEPIDPESAIEKVLAETRDWIEPSGFRIEKHIDGDLPPVRADAAALAQCLRNLVSNALKYGGENRWIGVRACKAVRGRYTEVQVTVEDRGVGISPEDQSHIFDPFYRGRAAIDGQIHGNGLGLSITRDAILAMGGRISVKSSPGKGSSFTLHLAAAPPSRKSAVSVQPDGAYGKEDTAG